MYILFRKYRNFRDYGCNMFKLSRDLRSSSTFAFTFYDLLYAYVLIHINLASFLLGPRQTHLIRVCTVCIQTIKSKMK